MITELSIENFALIDRVSIQFGPGLTVLTGETGAGKSIIVGALSLAMGARGSADVVRDQSESARVDVAFDTNSEVQRALETMGLPIEDSLVLSRSISSDGRSKCWINGRPATVGSLAALGSMLVDYHGQHEHQRLMSASSHISYVDAYGGEVLANQLREYKSKWTEMGELAQRLESEIAAQSESQSRVAQDEASLEELEAVSLGEADEIDHLIQERERIRNSTSLFESASGSLRYLEDEQSAPSISTQLIEALRALAPGGRLDPQMDKISDRLSGLADEVSTITSDIRSYREGLAEGKNRQEEVEGRLFQLEEIVRRYGPKVSDAIQRRDQLRDQLLGRGGETDAVGLLETQLGRARDAVADEGKALSKRRKKAAAEMCAAVGDFMQELGLNEASITTDHRTVSVEEAGSNGMDSIEFRVSLNLGEPSKALALTASGGEISRIMLSIKLALDGRDPVGTLVFDEIDSGVGGSKALHLGEKMAKLSSMQQVICVTHLPQIAAWADHQIVVDKQTIDGRTITTVQPILADERPGVLSRMLGSVDGSAGLAHAEEMFRTAQQEKKIALG